MCVDAKYRELYEELRSAVFKQNFLFFLALEEGGTDREITKRLMDSVENTNIIVGNHASISDALAALDDLEKNGEAE